MLHGENLIFKTNNSLRETVSKNDTYKFSNEQLMTQNETVIFH
jgi:hypothetical protein